MSKRGKRQPVGPDRDRASRQPDSRPRSSSLVLGGLASAVVLVTIAIAYLLVHRAQSQRPFPAPSAATIPGDRVSFADFVGAESCRDCHSEQYHAWQVSTHGRAGGAPARDRIIAPFNGVPIRMKDAVVTPAVNGKGEYLFTVAQQGRPPRVFRVDQVVGGGFMAGGGTQAFFSAFPDGTLRFLPFDYSRTAGRWFCNTRMRGALPLGPDIALADCTEWTPRRVLGSTERFPGCQQCHGSQIQLDFDSASHRYATRFTTLAVNCESCHGPGRRHVELARSGRIGQDADVGMRALATLGKEESLGVCFQCHAVKSQLRPGYLPGRPLREYFALKFPLLLDTLYYPDGRTRTFGYQEGHLSSDCYRSGSMTCVDCHDPHSQRYRDVSGGSLLGRFDNGQCTGCHPSKATPIERHSHHAASSPGSACVSCHMPYLQQPEVGHSIRYARSDHTIPLPRPEFDSRLGVESACSLCHRNQPPQRLQAQVVAWYGELKPHRATVTSLLAADSIPDLETGARRIVADSADPMGAFAGTARILDRYSRIGAPPVEGQIIDRLKRLANHPDVDLKALAFATLHLIGGGEASVRSFLSGRLGRLGEDEYPVRERWSWVLKTRGDSYLNAGDARSAASAYEKAKEVAPRDPGVLRALGVAYTRLGELDRAMTELRHSLELNPNQVQAEVDLGTTMMQRGDMAGAIAAFRQALAINPEDPIGYANLGLALVRSGDPKGALEPLEKAVSLDPSLADANFILAQAQATLGRLDRAADALQKGLEFQPQNAAARQMLQDIRR
ncbi:MAG: tetratricopeptide repeat protein [Gemmatimonadetes bacterium]|nr:tetratricopeptide repeat protein [Gemmatimonadota bacterium]